MNLKNYPIKKEFILVDINKASHNQLLKDSFFIYLKENNRELLKCNLCYNNQEEIQISSVEPKNNWKATHKKNYINYDKIKFYIEIEYTWIRHFIEEINNSINSYDFLLENKIIKSKMTKKMIVLFDNYLILSILSFL